MLTVGIITSIRFKVTEYNFLPSLKERYKTRKKKIVYLDFISESR